MRSIVLLVAAAVLPSSGLAQERWQRLPATAGAFHVDLRSLSLDHDLLRARVQTGDVGGMVVVQDVEVRCGAELLRIVARRRYEGDTGRPLPLDSNGQVEALWIGYPAGSEGHALLSSLCRLGRDRKLLGSIGARQA